MIKEEMNTKETFEEFVYNMQEENPYQDFSLTELLRQTWQHQQYKITALEARIKELESELKNVS